MLTRSQILESLKKLEELFHLGQDDQRHRPELEDEVQVNRITGLRGLFISKMAPGGTPSFGS